MSIRDLMCLFFGMAIVNSFIAYFLIQSFLSGTKAIKTAQDMAKFKSLARQQMYQALLQIVFMIGGSLIGVFGIVTGRLYLLLYLIILNGVIYFLGMMMKSLEKRVRAMEVSDPAMKAEYERVCNSWVKKPFPDF